MLSPVSAVEQLQAMAVKRQYKEAAGQLEVGIKLLKYLYWAFILGYDRSSMLDGIRYVSAVHLLLSYPLLLLLTKRLCG